MLDINPEIVHFSGHGTISGALCFQDNNGQVLPISTEALSALFAQFKQSIRCVILNACYSAKQADVIAKYVDFVVGMDKSIGDDAAIAFSIGFYQALGAGRPFIDAYHFGVAQIQLQGIPEHLTPKLIASA